MSKFTFGIAVVVLAAALSAPAYAGPKGGGGGGGHGGGGGGGHGIGGGGGGPHFSVGRSGGPSQFSVSRSHGPSQFYVNRGRSPSQFNISRSRGPSQFSHKTGTTKFGTTKLGSTKLGTNEHGTSKLGTTKLGAQNSERRSKEVRNALKSRSVAGALSDKKSLHDPKARTRIVENAAMAGKNKFGDHHHDHHGWWRHRHGGYGWVGPLFWPFAYYDFYDYAWWGYAYDDVFWDYGYGDIYVGLFGLYDYEDLVGYLPEYTYGSAQYASRTARRIDQPTTTGSRTTNGSTTSSPLAQMCGEDTRDIAGLPINQVQQAIQPDEQQRAALDDLGNASVKAAQIVKVACPTDVALTAPGRMKAMQQRIEAMAQAVDTVRPPLEKFYGFLNDEQKARLTALGSIKGKGQTTGNGNSSLGQRCGAAQSGVTNWPAADIEQFVRPTEAQRASLVELQSAADKAVDMLKACPSETPLTPPARLKTVADRLDTMLQAVNSVNMALNKFYAELTDEQKARFDAIGPQRTSEARAAEDQPRAERTQVRKHRRQRFYY